MDYKKPKKNTSQGRWRTTFMLGAILFISLFMMSFISGAITTSGTISYYMDGPTNYTIVIFNSNGYFNTTSLINMSILIVGGGGGGGASPGHRAGAGGGAGGLVYGEYITLLSGNYPIIIGNGGISNMSGGNSSFNNIIGVGGGNGGDQFLIASNGGSGGGAGGYSSGIGLTTQLNYTGVIGYGNNGTLGVDLEPNYGAGAGGGAGGKGTAGTSTAGGNGGIGKSYTIYNGTSLCYAGGGGGSSQLGTAGTSTCGGGAGNSNGVGYSAINGTGGGGGGGGGSYPNNNIGGMGGSGIIILRFTISSTPPVILNSPINYYNSTSATVTFNITATDNNPAGTIKNVSLYLDGVLNETNTTETVNGTYFFTKTLSIGTHTWIVEAWNNNSKGANSSSRTLTTGIYENSRTYSTAITEGSTGSFVLNISTGYPITSAYLSYNGTLKPTTLSATSSYTTISSTFSVPQVSATSITPLHWVLYYSGGSWNSTSSNQTIYNFNLDNCSVNSLTFVNFTLRDEISQSEINGTALNSLGKINLQVFPFADRTIFYNFSTIFNRTNPFSLCFNSSLFTGEKYSFDMEVEYTADTYVNKFYHLQNETLDNSFYNTNISLYLINESLAKTFKIIYKDSGYRAVEDAIVKVYRKYVGEGVFKLIESPITDYNGETTASLEENDVVYSFYVYKYGTLLSSFENVFVKCQYSSIDQCTLDLNAFSSGVDVEDLETAADFNFTLGYNETSREVLVTFNIPSGSSSLILLTVITDDALGSSVCTDTLTSSSGNLACVVPNTFGNSTVVAKLYKDGNLQSFGRIKLDQNPVDIYGGTLVILGLFVLFSLVGASVTGNPVVMIISFLIGIICLISLNLIANDGFIGATASVLFLIVAIIIVLIKMGKRN